MLFDAFGYARVRAASVGCILRRGATRGALPGVGGTWTYAAGVFAVAHPRPRCYLHVLTGVAAPPGVVTYPVRLLAPAAAPHKPRRWFACPGCGRKCTDLYLKAPRPTLACRLCHGMTYRSQSAPRSARAFARRHRGG